MAKIDLGRVVGADGKSAYQIAVEHGFEGTEQEWIDSLNYDDDIYALDEKINQEIENRTNADSELNNVINQEISDRKNADDNLQNQIDSINEKIPEAATASNQLADKKYVLDKIASNSGSFIGAFNSFEELQNYKGTLVKNDYAFIITVETSLKSYKRYQWTGSEWKFEYDLNNSSFTDEQWEAINSNVTATWKTNVDSSLSELDNKQDKLTEIQLRNSADFINCNSGQSAAIQYFKIAETAYRGTSFDTFQLEGFVSGILGNNERNYFAINIVNRGGTSPYHSISGFLQKDRKDWDIEIYTNEAGDKREIYFITSASWVSFNGNCVNYTNNGSIVLNNLPTSSTTAPTGTLLGKLSASTELQIIGNKADKSHTHSEYHKKENLNIKTFGSPNGSTRYVTVSAADTIGGIEVSSGYAGKWVFSVGCAPIFIGSANFKNYGLVGWAWSSDNKKLYLKFTGWRGVSVSCLGTNNSEVGSYHNAYISDWTTTAPSGITFRTEVYCVDSKANYHSESMVGLGFTKDSNVSVRDFWLKLFEKYGNNGVIKVPHAYANAAYVGDNTTKCYMTGGTLIYTASAAPTTAWADFSAIFIGGGSGNVYHIRGYVDSDTTTLNNWSVSRITKEGELANWNCANTNYTGNPNNCEIGKWYSINTVTNSTNMPRVDGWASVITFAANNNSSYKQQLCFYNNGNNIYTRTQINGTWGSWEKLAKTSEVDSALNGKANVNGSTADFQANSHFYKSLGKWKDYEQVVIPILELTSSINANRYSNGRIFSHRDNGLYVDPIVEWKCNKMYNATASEKYNLVAYKLKHFKFATFEYDGKKYLGVLWNYVPSQPVYCYFDGYTNNNASPMFTVIPYYNSNTKAVLNEEIKNSLTEVTDYEYGALATKSVGDKNGNDIVDTYATKTELSGKADVSHAHDDKVNYHYTTMVSLGFTKGSYVSVRDFWAKLYDKFGTNGVVQFSWSTANAAYVGTTGNNVYIGGGTLIYTCNKISTWTQFSAIYYCGGEGSSVYNIKCSINADTTTEASVVSRLVKLSELDSHTHKSLEFTVIPAGADLNDYTTVGLYVSTGNKTFVNAPASTFTNFSLEVYRLLNEKYVAQRITQYATNEVWVRTQYYNSGSIVWSSWTNYSKVGHTHDDRYYTETEIDTKLSSYAKKSDLANAGMSVSAKNVMESTGSIDFNTNKALFQLPIYSADATDQPTALGAMWIQEIKEDEE